MIAVIFTIALLTDLSSSPRGYLTTFSSPTPLLLKARCST